MAGKSQRSYGDSQGRYGAVQEVISGKKQQGIKQTEKLKAELMKYKKYRQEARDAREDFIRQAERLKGEEAASGLPGAGAFEGTKGVQRRGLGLIFGVAAHTCRKE